MRFRFWATWRGMHASLSLSESTLLAFALVLSRIAGIFIFVPLPVQDAGPGTARIAMALACTMALYPRWPVIDADGVGLSTLVLWMVAEIGLGTAIGLMVGFISESLTFGAQLIALQAGYGYASVVDPTTQADSDVLKVVAQLAGGLLFFTTGLHRYVISAFAASLDTYPPGSFTLSRDLATTVIQLGSSVFLVGLRLASPIIGLLLVTDLALALLGRVSSHLQLSNHAFSAKMLLSLVAMAAVFAVAPALYQSFSSEVLHKIQANFAR